MKLLLVDDDRTERSVLRDILRAQGAWTIAEASGGKEAFDMLLGGLEPAVCFVDIKMPEVDGAQFLTMVRQEPSTRHLKVIVTSGTRDRELILSMGKLGISGYVLKPYDLQKTTASLNQILGAAHVTVPALASRNLLAKTALLIDDDALTRNALNEIVKNEVGWESVEAEDGLTALEQMRSGLRPDLVVLDLKMPRLDGHSLLTRMREDPNLRRIPVVIVSGQQDRDQIRALAQLRIAGYVLKPLDLQKARLAILAGMKASVPTVS